MEALQTAPHDHHDQSESQNSQSSNSVHRDDEDNDADDDLEAEALEFEENTSGQQDELSELGLQIFEAQQQSNFHPAGE